MMTPDKCQLPLLDPITSHMTHYVNGPPTKLGHLPLCLIALVQALPSYLYLVIV